MRTPYLVLLLLIASAPASAALLSVQPAIQTFSAGQSFLVNVNVSDVRDLYGYQFDVGFNPAILAATSISEGSFLSGAGSTFFVPGSINNAAGAVVFNAGTLLGAIPGASGSGMLATVTFKALTNGESAINLSNITLVDSNASIITAATIKGFVTVVGTPEPGTNALLGIGMVALCAAGYRRSTVHAKRSCWQQPRC